MKRSPKYLIFATVLIGSLLVAVVAHENERFFPYSSSTSVSRSVSRSQEVSHTEQVEKEQARTPKTRTTTARSEGAQLNPGRTQTITIAQARHLLHELPRKGRAPMTGYRRSNFGKAWSDNVSVLYGRNGCSTRNDILRSQLDNVTYETPAKRSTPDNCIVATGTLRDPYTGKTIHFIRGAETSQKVQIDHVVALGDAWQKGAALLTPDERRDFANDPENLLAVDGPTNNLKGKSDAATWLPPRKTFRCEYVSRQIHVKFRYRLWVTPAEKQAMGRVLDACQ